MLITSLLWVIGYLDFCMWPFTFEQWVIFWGFVITILIALGGWAFSWWQSKKIHRLEITMNRPILFPNIEKKIHDPKDSRDKATFSKFVGKLFWLYTISNEGRLGVERWGMNTYYLKNKVIYRVEPNDEEMKFNTRATGNRIPPNKDASFYPALIFIKNPGKKFNLFYEVNLPRYLIATYEDLGHINYCSCIAFGNTGIQTQTLRHREIEKELNSKNYDKKSNQCKDCPLVKYPIKPYTHLKKLLIQSF